MTKVPIFLIRFSVCGKIITGCFTTTSNYNDDDMVVTNDGSDSDNGDSVRQDL